MDHGLVPQRLTMQPDFSITYVTTRSMAALVGCSPQFLRKVVRRQGLNADVFLVSERRCGESAIPLWSRTRFEEIRAAVTQAKEKHTRRN